ncbi:winged helix DNA-binding domain-containing protein [Myxococcus sp. K15C18031901]|uniref:DNA glycosylase AlkZ-like family protein n=1 Tax=Myxococcus dinghuensis TaxID=2906761 RepID=UPI0020A727C2|nr:crosslink repair DNA glycosylase YcaQ family protein [Myxococcus dinghuensis]MCP3098908.1 winged helix DNA-binding domain-containing protein [Myxococcus dinghuensis]
MPRKNAAPAVALRISLDRARAHWLRTQGLAEPLSLSLEALVGATGWVRTLGGADVYLALAARAPDMKRADLDRAVEASRLQVIPAVRGCIYLVPGSEVALTLRVAEAQYRKRAEREHAQSGIEPRELVDVGEAVLVALRKGPLSTDALRKALPAGVVRSLGEAGKKAGISSTLPPALRHLEFEGKVERSLEGGRLDTERYLWRLPARSPFAGAKVPADVEERNARLAALFFRQFGPATVADFAAWAGFSQREAKAAVERAALVPVEVEGLGAAAFVPEDAVAALGVEVPPATSVSFLPAGDLYFAARGGPGRVTDPRHHSLQVPRWGSAKDGTLGEVAHMSLRGVLDGDRLAGFWEFDAEEGEVLFHTFEPLSPKRRKQFAARAAEVASFLEEEVGHARSFTLDTEASVAERAALIRSL